jgi:hypothetical protein
MRVILALLVLLLSDDQFNWRTSQADVHNFDPAVAGEPQQWGHDPGWRHVDGQQ